MNLQEIQERWSGKSKDKGEIQRQIWDRVAGDYYKRELPSFEKDPFLKILQDSFSLERGMTALDVGCGAGRYSLALAEKLSFCLGIDISPKMIDFAQKSASDHGVENAQFKCINWAEADIDALGLRESFDIVFAHMTPAIMDFDTLQKMIACSRRWCIMEKHARRTDAVLDEAFRAVGIDHSGHFDESLVYTFAALWAMGYSPEFHYRKGCHVSERPFDEMLGWCQDRASMHKDLTDQDKLAIEQVLRSHTVDGIVTETMESTTVTISWEVNP